MTRRVLPRPELSGRCRLWGGAGSCCLTLGPHWHECPGGRVPAWETGAFSLTLLSCSQRTQVQTQVLGRRLSGCADRYLGRWGTLDK